MSLCKYRNIFGAPGEGVHAYRLFGLAVVDVVGTLLGAYALSRYFDISLFTTTVSLFGLGIFSHWLFCVDSAIRRHSLKKAFNKHHKGY